MAGDDVGGDHPYVPFLNHTVGFGWSPEIRSLVTSVIGHDGRWAGLVFNGMDRDELQAALVFAVALLCKAMIAHWEIDAGRRLTNQEVKDRWARMSVQLDSAARRFDPTGSAVDHPFDVLDDDGAPG